MLYLVRRFSRRICPWRTGGYGYKAPEKEFSNDQWKDNVNHWTTLIFWTKKILYGFHVGFGHEKKQQKHISHFSVSTFWRSIPIRIQIYRIFPDIPDIPGMGPWNPNNPMNDREVFGFL